jgi:PAS domain S-box-containing protein
MVPLKVLILEAADADEELIAQRLKRSGLAFEARRVETRQDFEREVRQWRPDLVVADCSLPGFDGRSALQMVRQDDPDVPFIFVSGEVREDTALEAVREGATDYVFKDRSARLAPSVRRALEQVEERRKRRQAEEELRRSEERYRQLVELMPEVVVVHREGKVVFVNSQGAQLLGSAADSLVGKPVLDFVEPSHRAFAQNRLKRLLNGLETGVGELALLREDGAPVYMEAISRTIEYQGAPAILSVVRDISEQKRLEKEILEISGREQRRIGRDLHDTVSQNLAGAALLGKALQQKLQKQAPELAGEAQKIVTLMSQAVSQAKALSRGLNPVDLTSDSLVNALRALAANTREFFGIACTFDMNTETSWDETTAHHLYHVALEAVNNASKHSGATRIDVSLMTSGDQQTLTIKDNGRGFNCEEGRLSGGMGLRIMEYRARVIGASLEITSRPDSGTTVVCVL